MSISPLSVQSLLVLPASQSFQLGSATGFLVRHDDQYHLITNWHVVSGRNPTTGQPLESHGGTPDRIGISYFMPPQPNFLTWSRRDEPLYDQAGEPRWLEHPSFGRRVDVVALPLTTTDGCELMPYDLTSPAEPLRALVSDFVDIIGFPFGLTAGGSIAVWIKGAIASEPDIDFCSLPCFLIDARTRQGQSGSPVVVYAAGGAHNLASGTFVVGAGPTCNLLGVYSGRINEQSDIGMVWKLSAIREILEGGRRGNGSLIP